MGKRPVKQQRLGDRKLNKPGSDEHSAYWDYYHSQNEEGENRQANPDVLEDCSQNVLWPSKHTELEDEVLSELKNVDFSQFLTTLEIKALKMYVTEKKSLKQIQQAMSLSKRRVYALLESSGMKIRRKLDINE